MCVSLPPPPPCVFPMGASSAQIPRAPGAAAAAAPWRWKAVSRGFRVRAAVAPAELLFGSSGEVFWEDHVS